MSRHSSAASSVAGGPTASPKNRVRVAVRAEDSQGSATSEWVSFQLPGLRNLVILTRRPAPHPTATAGAPWRDAGRSVGCRWAKAIRGACPPDPPPARGQTAGRRDHFFGAALGFSCFGFLFFLSFFWLLLPLPIDRLPSW